MAKKPEATEVAWGMRRTPLGWQVVKYSLLAGKVVAEKASEPDLRSVALEQFRIAVGEVWGDI